MRIFIVLLVVIGVFVREENVNEKQETKAEVERRPPIGTGNNVHGIRSRKLSNLSLR